MFHGIPQHTAIPSHYGVNKPQHNSSLDFPLSQKRRGICHNSFVCFLTIGRLTRTRISKGARITTRTGNPNTFHPGRYPRNPSIYIFCAASSAMITLRNRLSIDTDEFISELAFRRHFVWTRTYSRQQLRRGSTYDEAQCKNDNEISKKFTQHI